MWLSFIFAALACVAFLYVPGFLFFWGLGIVRLRALVLAPIASVACYCVLGIAFVKLGVPCTWLTVGSLSVILCAIPLVIRALRKRLAGQEDASAGLDWATLAIYVAVGLVAATCVYVLPLGAADAFSQEYDNAFHMEVIRSFVDSAKWSTLEVSKYLADDAATIAPMPGTSFYPALWHVTCAFVVSLLGCPITVAINATNFVVASILFPTGVMLFISTFVKSRLTVRLGALVALAFLGFPWLLMYWGPLYANVFGLAFVPVVSSLFVRIVDSIASKSLEAVDVCSFLLGVVVLAVAQTSSIFTCIVLLAPYCVYRIWTYEQGFSLFGRKVPSRLCAVLFILFVIVVWLLFVFAPFMSGPVFCNEWGLTRTPSQAVNNVLVMQFGWFPEQYVVALLVAVGFVHTFGNRKYFWASVSYLLFCAMYVACTSIDGIMRNILAGFWYMDSYRLVACMAIAGIPLAALGLSRIVEAIRDATKRRPALSKACMSAFVIAMGLLLYMPNFSVGSVQVCTALGFVEEEYYYTNHNQLQTHHISLDADEEAFLDGVKEIAGDAVVVNMPDDGSVFAYALNGINTLYRDYRGYYDGRPTTDTNETDISRMIRKYAMYAGSNQILQDAFEDVGARYVLLLDDTETFGDQHITPTYNEALWIGLAGIMDDTPGFKLVLAEGDMRLYEITATGTD